MGHSQSKLLKTAVKEEKWNKVDSLLRHSKYNSRVLKGFITACEEHHTVYVDSEILSHCSLQQWNRLLETAVKKERWEEMHVLLKDRNYGSSVVDHFITVCEKYGVIHVDREIVSQCNTQQLDRLLTLATTLKQWDFVGRLLKAGGSQEKRVWVIEQVCQMSADCQSILPHVDDDFLSQCNTQQLDCLLTTFTKKRQWEIVEKVLNAGGCHEKRVWAIEQSCDVVFDGCWRYLLPHVDEDFLSHCTTQQLDRLLTAFTTRKQWHIVRQVLNAGGSHEKRVWVIEQSCDVYDGWRYILPHVDQNFLSQCNTQQLDCLLTAFTTIKRWQIVGTLLKAGGSHENRVWVIEQACLTCERYDRNFDDYYDDEYPVIDFMMYILTHINDDFLSQCSSQQLDRLLTVFTTTGRWQLVDTVLKAGGSHEKRVWAITQACDQGYAHCILSHITDDLLTNYNTDQLDNLLTTVTCRWWDFIDKVLRAGGSHGKRVWVIKEACQRADHLNFQRYISPHCDDQLYKQINNPESGLTVLFSAMLNVHCPQNMVAECIRLGFSTHQPPPVLATTADIAETVTTTLMRGWNIFTTCGISASPFLLAVSRGMPVVAHMLYESGSSSYSELLHLYTWLLDLSDPHTEDGRKLLQGEYLTEQQRRYYFGLYPERYNTFMNTLTTFLPYLREMASTPRSLESSCRLVISHCLTGGEGRDRAVQELPLPEGIKDYLLFSDLTDPHYQPRMYGTL